MVSPFLEVFRRVQMWCLEPEFSGGLVSVGLMTELILEFFLQPYLCYDSMIPLQQVGDLRGV